MSVPLHFFGRICQKIQERVPIYTFDTFLSDPHISGRWQSTSSSSRHGCDGASKHFCPRHQLPPHLHRLPHPRPPPDPRQRSQKPEEQFGRRLCCLRHHLLLSSLSSLSAWPQVSHCMFSQLQKITSILIFNRATRCCLVLGGSLYTVYCSQLFFPSLSLQYTCSVLLGAGAAILWTAQVSQIRYQNPEM